jgi:hypothetical protein
VLAAVCVVLGAGIVVVAAGSGDEPRPAPAPTSATASSSAPAEPAARLKVDRFDADRAWAELRRQVRSGPRPAGSRRSRALAERIRRALPSGRFEPVGKKHPGLRNVVGTLPGRRPAIMLAAHYDTKDIPGFVGANDGAGGTAMLLELARGLRRGHRPRGGRELRFVFFDGEESPDDAADFYETGLRGSKAYAARHRGEVATVVLLDFVAEKNVRIPREQGSDAEIWEFLRATAGAVGAQSAFPDEEVGEILDDHTPFARAGVPAIDLIDFDFPCWHKICDDLDVVSRESLDRVGETIFRLASQLRRAS